MRILIACEFSGVVREAFNAISGCYPVSCDLLPPEDKRFDYHMQCDVMQVLNDGWDMMIAFPPCTDLCVSGARWFAEKRASGQQQRSIDFFLALANAPIKKKCVENPIGIMSRHFRKPDQIIQPWQFGHGETKATCLWLENLPLLKPEKVVSGREQRIWKMPPSKNRGLERSRTFTGIAQAMANQWGGL